MQYRINWSGRSHDYSQDDVKAILEVVHEAGALTQGPYLKQFEQDFAEYINADNCFGVTNCTHALELSADLIGLQPGDEVIIPGHTYCASAIPFGRKGAKLIWSDIESDTLLSSLKTIEPLVTSKTKAVVVVHLYGALIPDIDAIADFCKQRGIALVEDVAQAMGAHRNGKHAGTFGDYGCFSFHAQKNITTLGEGGVLRVASAKEAKVLPRLRHNGHVPFENQERYWQPAMVNVDVPLEAPLDHIWPHNFSMSEVQAALGSSLLKRADELTGARRKRGQMAMERLNKLPEIRMQKMPENESEHSFHLLPAYYKSENGKTRDDLIEVLGNEFAVKAIVQYYPLYRYDLFKKMGAGEASCPATDEFFDDMISFPFHQWMSDDDFEYMLKSIEQAVERLRSA